MLRYGVCFVIAMLLILAGVVYVRRVDRSVEEQIRQRLREDRAAGKLSPGIDPDGSNIHDRNVPVTSAEALRINIANLLVRWRFVLIPLVLLGSLAIAWELRRSGP